MKQKKQSDENPEQVEYREAQKNLKDAEFRMGLRSRGIDPYELSQKDLDELKRLINKIQQVNESAQSKMKASQQEGNNELVAINKEIENIISRVYQKQNPLAYRTLSKSCHGLGYIILNDLPLTPQKDPNSLYCSEKLGSIIGKDLPTKSEETV